MPARFRPITTPISCVPLMTTMRPRDREEIRSWTRLRSPLHDRLNFLGVPLRVIHCTPKESAMPRTNGTREFHRHTLESLESRQLLSATPPPFLPDHGFAPVEW